MGKKNGKNESEKKNGNDEQQLQKKKENEHSEGGEKKDDGLIILKVRMDCECQGCATKIRKLVRGIEGVESVKEGGDFNKLTVSGKIDPMKLREMVEKKTKKKADLVSPLPKKDKENSKEKDGGGGGEKKAEGKQEKKADDKKSKDPPVTTAVMKVNLHCHGCIQKIRKTVTKIKGYQDMSIDEKKDLVTVKGTMDMKALTETLKERLKRTVEIVPSKKDCGEKKDAGQKKDDAEKKEQVAVGGGGGGGEKNEKNGEQGKIGGDGWRNDGGVQTDGNRIQYVQYGYPNSSMQGFGLGYPSEQYHPPQMFSDENPNACSIM